MSLEVAALRRDGFDGPIELAVHGLPEGVTATGLRIPAGQSRGQILLTAADGGFRWNPPIDWVDEGSAPETVGAGRWH